MLMSQKTTMERSGHNLLVTVRGLKWRGGKDMGTKLLRLQLHEAEAFEAKASALASWFGKLKASASALAL